MTEQITPEDVAKGLLEYMCKQTDTIMISKKQFTDIGLSIAKEMGKNDNGCTFDPLFRLTLTLDRAELVARLVNKLFNEKEEN